MSLIVFLVFGLIVGLLARALMPGRQSMGIAMTTLLGTLGSFLGGLLASLFSESEVMRIHAAGLIGSVIGAMAILALGSIMYRMRSYP
jgi:uncharacterized membrane protein YeaQ/YmgE (transglycosylase-associated protein family)